MGHQPLRIEPFRTCLSPCSFALGSFQRGFYHRAVEVKQNLLLTGGELWVRIDRLHDEGRRAAFLDQAGSRVERFRRDREGPRQSFQDLRRWPPDPSLDLAEIRVRDPSPVGQPAQGKVGSLPLGAYERSQVDDSGSLAALVALLAVRAGGTLLALDLLAFAHVREHIASS